MFICPQMPPKIGAKNIIPTKIQRVDGGKTLDPEKCSRRAFRTMGPANVDAHMQPESNPPSNSDLVPTIFLSARISDCSCFGSFNSSVQNLPSSELTALLPTSEMGIEPMSDICSGR